MPYPILLTIDVYRTSKVILLIPSTEISVYHTSFITSCSDLREEAN